MSETRRDYFGRLLGRIVVLLLCAYVWLFKKESFAILEGFAFFDKFSIFHFLWAVWVLDMFLQIIPVRNKVPLGSQKLFRNRFRPIVEKINYQALKAYVVSTTKSAYKVFILWCLLIGALGVLYYTGIMDHAALFMVSVLFYVCDLICVLIWCPFRLIMKNKCCTTCRIFNWDHLMMFSPLVYVGGFYCLSLLFLSIAAFAVWEICVFLYPERFWEMTNVALKCSECTDKLCTQYCQKLRKEKNKRS